MATFLALTNRLLRRLNEVEIEQADFASVRGVQALAKDAINASIRYINTQQFEWPFNSATDTETLVVNQNDYSFPANLKVPDWDSFVLLPDDSLSFYGRKLKKIERDQWLQYLYIDDLNAVPADGRATPQYVFPSADFGYAVSPVPDEAYTLSYDYYIAVTDLSAYSDEPTIPDLYSETIIQGGLYHLYMFRDNTEMADRAKSQLDDQIKIMRKILVNSYDTIRSTMIVKRQSAAPQGFDTD